MKQTRRTKRVAGLIRQKLGRITATEIKDPALGVITITRVDVTIDIKIARVYYTVIGGRKPLNKQINIIQGLSKLMRQSLAHKINLKYMPEIILEYDRTAEKAQKIEKILAKIKNKKKDDT